MIYKCPYRPAKRLITIDLVYKEKDKPKEVKPELEKEELALDLEN